MVTSFVLLRTNPKGGFATFKGKAGKTGVPGPPAKFKNTCQIYRGGKGKRDYSSREDSTPYNMVLVSPSNPQVVFESVDIQKKLSALSFKGKGVGDHWESQLQAPKTIIGPGSSQHHSSNWQQRGPFKILKKRDSPDRECWEGSRVPESGTSSLG